MEDAMRIGGTRYLILAMLMVAGCAPGDEAPEGERGAVPASDVALAFSQELPTEAPAAAAETVQQEVADSRRNAIVAAAERVTPAVVTISTVRTQRVRPRSLFEQFMAPGLRQATGFGSGFIIDAERGVVLTNEHVIRDAERIMVTLADGRDLEAELVGADEVVDVAVLRIDATDLEEAPLGTTRGLIIGEWAVAIGNPFGTRVSNTDPTVTVGVVSAVGRHIVPTSEEQGFYLGMIQTDASINPGNSGGPLVNALGQVIGVNASIFSRSGGSEGLGFAIPIDRALRVADDLLRYGDVRRAWLGLDVEAEEADVWGRTRGVRVSRVVEGSPAERAGIRAGARLLEAGGRRLTTPLDYEDVLLDLRAGETVELRPEGGSPVIIEAVALPSMRAERVRALEDLDVITVTPEVRAERGIRSEAGALVVSASPDLQRMGIEAGDVIVQINNTSIRSGQDLARYFASLRDRGSRGRIVLYIERDGSYVMRPLYWNG